MLRDFGKAIGCYWVLQPRCDRCSLEGPVHGHHHKERGTEVPHKGSDAPPSALLQSPGAPIENRKWWNAPPTKLKGKILSISAVAADHHALRRILNDQLWQIEIASSYREAVAYLCRDRVDVVICECHLQDGTWKDLLGHIAEMPAPPALVVTSGAVDAHFRSEVRALGGYDAMTKPLNADEVMRVLASEDLHRSTWSEMPVHT
jgi:PleD family two-component response regulator